MGSRKKRKRKSWGSRALVALVVTGLSAAGVKCGLERGLKELGLDGEGGPSRPSPSPGRPSSSAPPKGSAPPRPPAAGAHLELGVPARADLRAGQGQAAASDDHLMIKPQYALSYNRSRNVANWVSWRLDAASFGATPRYRGKFLADGALPDGWYRVQHDDYTGSGFDRGHMVRSEERTRTAEDNKATFLLTNILPQRHDLNAGPWLRLEEECQELAQKKRRVLFLVAGGLFDERERETRRALPATIGNGVAVPAAYFKIAVVLEPGQGAADIGPSTRVIAAVMPNETGILDEGWEQYRTTVDDIERRAGYDFLTAVPEATQRVIEARVDSEPAGR
ncbi:DNA/RNA non-specific endonuclease [Sorangium cellulosum]|uniref:DNA/RNA non-specific endonuclease n=1 Tax=Sorangium cellulosum TaxID=56 RepID=A0A4P2PX04_SORCE|nr:DNA/RNA non-specific endonuclease [Sorangium cellulosum]AUX21260.1 DNA/RNA non-specific endonuclease [Sorangium cellulosum]